MIDIDMEFERKLYEKLSVLRPIIKKGSIEILYRLNKEKKIKIGDFSRKYQMHSDTVKQASEALREMGLIIFEREGRKKNLILTEKGKTLIGKLDEFIQLL